ncbi:hypothetical protein EMPS_00701 [Entomortierella parvispora]|uniref:Kinetochore protein fta7 n=1 Tax=Entomortierella parvispora TaxID=205924 RepID=A0A9P3H1G4_9FUNG|nr:hypothetical protein EMPS_00701 [Entomortierella parvispora]
MAKAKKSGTEGRWKTQLPFKSSTDTSSKTAPGDAVPATSSKHRVEKTSKVKSKSKAQPRPRSKKRAAKVASTTTAAKTRSATSKPAAVASSSAASSSNTKVARVLSDEEEISDSAQEDEDDEEEEEEDHDHQLGLRPTLRVVSKATVRRTWKPVSVKTRTHIQTLMSSLFPAAISRARGDRRKIAVQMKLNQLMQKMNDCLSELDVPPPGRDRGLNYGQLTARNRELEATLVPDLEHIRDLELRLEQEQRLAEQDEAELTDFQDKKRALDQRTTQLHRSKLHPLLRDRNLQATTSALCREDNDYSHLSVADQRLLSLMDTSQGGDFGSSEMREPLYNPDQDLMINKASKRLGSRLSAIERNGEKLDPLMNLVAATKDKVQELSVSTFGSNPQNNPFGTNIMSPLRR